MILKKRKSWKRVEISKVGDSNYQVLLDKMQLKTELGNLVLLPKELAVSVSKEWRSGQDFSKIKSKFYTKFCFRVFDYTALFKLKVFKKIIEYADCDLICYLAESPEELTKRQKKILSNYIDWSNQRFSIKLKVATGISYVKQEDKNKLIIQNYLERLNDIELTIIDELTNLTGSFFISCALFNKAVGAMDAWNASNIEDSYRIEKWGRVTEETDIIKAKEEYFFSLAKLIDKVH